MLNPTDPSSERMMTNRFRGVYVPNTYFRSVPIFFASLVVWLGQFFTKSHSIDWCCIYKLRSHEVDDRHVRHIRVQE